MFCQYCGKEIDDSAVVCPNCGYAIEDMIQNTSAMATWQSNGIIGQHELKPIRRGKYIAAIILTIIGYVFMLVAVGVVVYFFTNIYVGESMGAMERDEMNGFLGITALLLFVAEPCIIAACVTNSDYRKANKGQGIKVSKLCTFIYILDFIGLIPLLPILLVYIVYCLVIAAGDKIASMPTDGSSSKIKVKDENGDEHTLTHSSGRNFKDEKGNWWTQDYFDSNKFSKD